MSEIQMHYVLGSSNIALTGYDEKTSTMRVQFNSGAVYEAVGPTKADYDAFTSAKSKGSHFAKVLKRAFVWNRIEKKGE